MKAGVTVIIPTHERHRILSRAVEYYGKLSVSVLIVDSSKFFFDEKLPENITYMHLPGMYFGDKLNAGLCAVNTPFSCLSADDDFLAQNGLKVGKEFLEENLDYVSVHGNYIQFDPSNPKELYKPLYIEMIGYKNDSDIIKNRVLASSKFPQIYSLHRTEILRKSIFITTGLIQVTLVEISIALVGMCYGKHTVLPIFWSSRDIVRYSKYIDKYEINNEKNELNRVVIDWEDFLNSSEGNKLKNNFIEVTSDVLIDSREAINLFDSVFINYFLPTKIKNKINFRQKLRNIIKFLLPNFILNNVHLSSFSRKRFFLKNAAGFPWSDSFAMKDWNSMIQVIIKFKDLN
jgi:glycosyltransferase domain-containing protein